MLAMQRLMLPLNLPEFETGTCCRSEDLLSGKVQLVKLQHQPPLLPEPLPKDNLPGRNFLYEMMRHNPLYLDYFSPAEEEEKSAEE